jgi:RNA polymerase sigma factor (TIGR02999 family)
MGEPQEDKVTVLLRAGSNGDRQAIEALLPILYAELHELAHRQRRRQNGPATLNTTALLHEAYIKLVRVDNEYSDRTHFFRTAAQAMRQILVDYARRRLAAKRGGPEVDETLDDAFFSIEQRSEEVIALDEALERLAELSPRQSDVVKMRYFGGFTLPETADLLDISPATAWRDWTAAQAWLQQELSR